MIPLPLEGAFFTGIVGCNKCLTANHQPVETFILKIDALFVGYLGSLSLSVVLPQPTYYLLLSWSFFMIKKIRRVWNRDLCAFLGSFGRIEMKEILKIYKY